MQAGERVRVIERPNDTWWWVEFKNKMGYVPVNHLSQDCEIDEWEDDEYFNSYGSLVSMMLCVICK